MKQCIKKGKHDFSFDFPSFCWNPSSQSYSITPLEGTDYNVLPDKDQWDWNKGGGFTFSLLSNTTYAVMWAWRYNPLLQVMEYALYTHDKSYDERFKVELLGSAPINEIVVIELRVEKKEYVAKFNSSLVSTTLKAPKSHSRKLCRKIGMWFGGANNEPGPYGGVAPQDMCFEVS